MTRLVRPGNEGIASPQGFADPSRMPLLPSGNRLAIAGLGRIAPAHLDALAALGAWQVTAACDPDPHAPGRAAFAGPVHPDIDALLAAEACDAVLVLAPPAVHADLTVRVLRRGLPVMVEKPVAPTAEAFARMEAAAADAGAALLPVLHCAWAAEVRRMAELIRAQPDRFGPVTSFAAAFHDPLHDGATLHPRARHLGGAWLDSGINALSVIGAFLPADRLRLAEIEARRAPDGTVVRAAATFTGPDGCRGSVTADWTAGRSDKETVLTFASGARAVLQHSAESLVLTSHDGSSRTLALASSFPRLVHHCLAFHRAAAEFLAGRGNDFRPAARAAHVPFWEAADALA